MDDHQENRKWCLFCAFFRILCNMIMMHAGWAGDETADKSVMVGMKISHPAIYFKAISLLYFRKSNNRMKPLYSMWILPHFMSLKQFTTELSIRCLIFLPA